MTKVLTALESRGAITRVDNPNDRRSKLVRLTAEGELLVERAMAAVMLADRRLLDGALGEEEIGNLAATLLSALRRLESE